MDVQWQMLWNRNQCDSYDEDDGTLFNGFMMLFGLRTIGTNGFTTIGPIGFSLVSNGR